jgi:flagellar export protein FliJ
MSKAAGFRLQPVLNFKSSKVDVLEMEFSSLKAAHLREVEALTVLQRTHQQHVDTLCAEQQVRDIDCQAIQQRQDYLHVLKECVVRQFARVVEAERHVETKREELVNMMKEKKVLEKLGERHHAQVKADQAQREARAVDDLMMSRYVNKR